MLPSIKVTVSILQGSSALCHLILLRSGTRVLVRAPKLENPPNPKFMEEKVDTLDL